MGKKGEHHYFANCDLLLASNPCLSPLQVWQDINVLNELDFVKYTASLGFQDGWDRATLTVPDDNLYVVLAVTMNVSLSGTFDDYGGPGSVPYSGTFELPLWNAWFGGPDLTNPSNIRRWPNFYFWDPNNTVFFTSGNDEFISGDAGVINFGPIGISNTFNVYYAKLRDKGVPVHRVRLEWEAQLGNRAAVFAPIPSQQITYPHFAGVGSTGLDLGPSAIIPDLRIEIAASYGLNPPDGDADFADIIEDIFKSGEIALETQTGEIQRGLNCCELPGMVQQNASGALEPTAFRLPFYRANKAGSVLIAFCTYRAGAGGVPAISDGAGNTWVPIATGDQFGMWYCASAIGFSGNVVTFTPQGGSQFDASVCIGEMDPDSTVVQTASASGSGGNPEISISVDGPCWILVTLLSSINATFIPNPDPPLHWDAAFEPAIKSTASFPMRAYKRYVYAAGTYSLKVNQSLAGNWTLAAVAISSPDPVSYPKPLGNILDDASMQICRAQATANGLWGSLYMDSQQPASAWLKQLYQAMNARPVWDGFALKSIPMSEQSAAGNGVVYTAPTASGPIADLEEDDFIADDSGEVISVKRAAQVDTPNILQIQFPNRASNYADEVASEPEPSGISLYGPRKESPQRMDCVYSATVARMLLGIAIRRRALIRNTYSAKAKAHMQFLTPGDLVTISDPKLGISKLPVIVTSVSEDDQFALSMEFEPFIYGMNAPLPLPVTTTAPNTFDFQEDAGNINVPIIFEPTPGLAGIERQLWLAVSNPNSAYGGCVAYISTDGGASYAPLGIIGDQSLFSTFKSAAGGSPSAVTGVLTAAWPASADPDTANDLSVDLTESLGSLASYQVSDEDNFAYPCLVAGGSSVPAAPSLSAVAGGTLAAATYFVKLTYVNASGESLSSDEASLAVAADNLLQVASPAAETGMTGYNVYAGTTAGAETKQNSTPIAIGTNWTEPASGLISGSAPPTQDSSAAIPYELMTYSVADLTAANKYTLKATGTGNHLRRGVFGAPAPAQGSAHATGARFVFLGPPNADSGLNGILKVPFQSQWVGVALMFKFTSFNIFGNAVQDISAVPAYSYTPTGLPGQLELVQINGS